MTNAPGTSDPDDAPIIHLEEEVDPPIVWRIDDILAFILFWLLGGVTFLQFFTRYVLNNSVAWTEEIGRYLLMTLTFVGAAIVFRRGSNIAVQLFVDILPGPLGRIVRFVVDVITVGFVALLVWFSWTVSQRMSIQRMTVIDMSMTVVYAGVGLGCVLMLWRALQAFFANARRGWRSNPTSEQPLTD